MAITLHELVEDPEYPMIVGRHFENETIVGPCIVAPGPNGLTMSGCVWTGSKRDTFWPTRNKDKLVGVIGLDDCTFINCRLVNIGLAGKLSTEWNFRRSSWRWPAFLRRRDDSWPASPRPS